MKDIGKAKNFNNLVKNFTNIEFPYWPTSLPYLERGEKIICVVEETKIIICESLLDVQYIFRLHETNLDSLQWFKGYLKR
jgi:hypothetical protein